MEILFRPLLEIFDAALSVAIFLVTVQVVLSWLITLNVISPYRYPIVASIHSGLETLFSPVYQRLRHYIPNFGGMDVAPIVLILGLWLVQKVISEILIAL